MSEMIFFNKRYILWGIDESDFFFFLKSTQVHVHVYGTYGYSTCVQILANRTKNRGVFDNPSISVMSVQPGDLFLAM